MRLNRGLILAIAATLTGAAGGAGAGEWIWLDGPSGEPMVVDARSAGTVYAGSYKSVDGGRRWARKAEGLPNTTATGLAGDPQQAGTLYLATTSGLFKTVDGAEHWLPVLAGEFTGVAVSASDPRTAYANTVRAFFRTTDGEHWEMVGSIPNSRYVHALIVDPGDPRTVYAGAAQRLAFGALVGALYKSSDAGATWQVLRDVATLSLAVAPTGTIYAGAVTLEPPYRGVVASSDGGRSWVNLFAGLAWSLAVDVNDAETVYAGVDGDVIYATHDGGVSWTAAEDGSDTGPATHISVDPLLPGTAYAATASGVYKTTDRGRHWLPLTTNLQAGAAWELAIDHRNTAIRYAATGTLFKSTNGGRVWAPIEVAPSAVIRSVAIDARDPGTLYAAPGSVDEPRLFRSTDGGTTWETVGNGFGAFTRIDHIVADPTEPQVLFATTDTPVILKSIDGGENWSSIDVGLGPRSLILALAIDPTDSATIYAATLVLQDVGLGIPALLKTTDGGSHWTPILTAEILALAIDPHDARHVYAAYTNAALLYESVDGGMTWTSMQSDHGPVSAGVSALAIDAGDPGNVYTGNLSGEIWAYRPRCGDAVLDVEEQCDDGNSSNGDGCDVACVVSGSCDGDCDGRGSVSIDELMRAVNVALGALPARRCGAADVDRDGQVTVDELVRAVALALGGCPSGAALDVN